ncbi:unnamed protein product [Symbiodinium natans]|uniref:Cyclic nucleotide-binding domain-containing protein n=1 Tax=Symbiodinium natans TaxID=878477 RepID=A0A812M3T0_9DINO|nr:unnamed protein product [Symbiodinium natans]
MPMELSSICMVFDSTLRCRGVHRYQYTILSGELGAADGAGFVFDSKVRRNNIQQMRTVFLNQRGVICIRDRQNVRKLKAQLPPLEVGLCLTLTVDLDALQLHFVVSSDQGVVGIADVCLDGLFDPTVQANFQSGFFCAVVTKEISVSLWDQDFNVSLPAWLVEDGNCDLRPEAWSVAGFLSFGNEVVGDIPNVTDIRSQLLTAVVGSIDSSCKVGSSSPSKPSLIRRLSSQYGCSEDEVERSLAVFRLADRTGDGVIQREVAWGFATVYGRFGVARAYRCDSDLFLGPVAKSLHKGLAIDDTTFQKCSWGIPRVWPNTQEKLTSIRLFKAWDKAWPDGSREEAWAQLLDAVRSNGIKVLVGTQITCDEADDDRDWRLVKELLQKLGRDHVMGVAVGNELELLQFKKGMDPTCIQQIWGGGYFYRKLTQRANDLDALVGFSNVPLTSVFGGYILSGEPFVEEPGARVTTFYRDVVAKFGKRWVFTVNIYPYFDPNNALDPGTTNKCTKALATTVCFEDTCNLPGTVAKMRSKMQLLTGTTTSLLWIGETGWSSPQAQTLAGSNPRMGACPAFSSLSSFRRYYNNFLNWDLTFMSSTRGPDHVFYFTTRDSTNFAVGEHFGLISDCDAKRCKLQSNSSLEVSTLTYEFTQLVERTLQVELSPEELDGYWQDLCPGNGPQRISFEEWFGWVRRNYLPFQELTVEAPVPESYELITSAVGVALAIYVLGQFDAVASNFRGLSGTPLTLWAPPLGSVVVLLFGPGLQGRRGAISDMEAVRTVLVACVGCATCAMLSIYSFGAEQPALTRAAAASGSLLWMRATRSLFAPAGAFATLAVDEALPRLPLVRDWLWVAEGVQLIVVPAIVGSLFLFAAQSAAVFLRSKFAAQEALSIQDTWLVGELRSTFPALPKRDLSKLLREAEEVFYDPRALLTEQGEVNPYLWLVVSGSLSVEVSGQVASTLERKAIIGEVTFLDPKDKLATATVYANPGGARTLRWSQDRLREFCEEESLLGEKVMAAISEELIEKMVRGRGAGRRSPEESVRLLAQLRKAFPQLGMAEVPQFLKVADNVPYTEGTCLTTQGVENRFLWLVLSGSLSVNVNGQTVAQLSEGALIGEATFLGFAEESLASATVRVDEAEGVQTLRWSQDSLRSLLVEDSGLRDKLMPAFSDELLRRMRGQEHTNRSPTLPGLVCLKPSTRSPKHLLGFGVQGASERRAFRLPSGYAPANREFRADG